jgi:cytochrome b6-f complex iron-sulfur subunit
MADNKKMSVAEILAAARKADGAKTAGAPAEPKPAAAAAAPIDHAPVTADAVAAEAVAAEAAAPTAESAPKKPAVAKPAGGARPSVAEMLAAARAEKAAVAAPAGKPAVAAQTNSATVAKQVPKKEAPKQAPKPAAAKAAPAAAPVEAAPKDTGSILAAARATVKPGPMSKAEAALKAPPAKPAAKIEKAKIAVPPMPAKPDYAKPKPAAAASESRRNFITDVVLGSFLGIGFTSMATTFGLWTLGTARFMYPNVLTEPPSKFKVGFPSNFAPGQVETKFIPQYGVWVVNYEYNGKGEIYALRSVCTHLGCTPNWLEGEQKFKCPCHGSGFYKDGINFEGPAPRPLERYAIRIADDGQLEIDKSKLFQEEIGQWSDPASYVAV